MAPGADSPDAAGAFERSGRSALEQKVPAVNSSGKYELDREAESLREMKMDIVGAIVGAHIVALHGVLARGLRTARVPNGEEFIDDIRVVARLPDDWMVTWIADVSDLNASDIARVSQFETEAVLQLFLSATQLPPRLKLPDACRSKRRMVALANSRRIAYNTRLRAFSPPRMGRPQ